MTRNGIATLLGFTVLSLTMLTGTAEGDNWCHDCWWNFKRDFHRNVMWPEPFYYPDRAVVRSTMNVMIHNGWRRQNLLGEHHFHQDATLNDSGRKKIRTVLTQVPPQHRTVYVERHVNPEVTERWIDAIKAESKLYLGHGMVANVESTHLQPLGRPAEEVDRDRIQYQEARPLPVLPAKKQDE